MQLKELFPDEGTLRSAAIKLLKDKGYTGGVESLEDAQIEDILIRIFKQIGDAYFETTLKIDVSSYPPNQWASALNHVGAMFSDYVGQTSFFSKILTKEKYNTNIKPLLDKGSAAMLSTKLTSGHIIYLKDIKDNGLTVHDPYGMRMPNGYVKNDDGVASKKTRITGSNSTFLSRTKYNPTLRAQINKLINDSNAGSFTGNMGESNFFSWQEVETYQIGKWINVLSKK